MLICGCGGPAAGWFGIVPALTDAGYRVVTFDHRGMAPSSSPPAPYAVADLVRDTLGLCDHLGVPAAVFVGHSMGGWVAETLAIEHPERVRAAAFLGSCNVATAWEKAITTVERDLARLGFDLPPLFFATETLRYLPNAELQQDAIVDSWLALIADMPVWPNPGRLGQYEACLAWSLDTARTGGWSSIRVPCLVLAFEHDVDSPPARAHEAGPDSRAAGSSRSRMRAISLRSHIRPRSRTRSSAFCVTRRVRLIPRPHSLSIAASGLGISRSASTGRVSTHSTASMPPMPATSIVGRSPIAVPEHGARERTERHRAPDHEPHRRVHAPEHAMRRDRLAQAHLVDVVDRPAEAEQQPRDDEVARSRAASGPGRAAAAPSELSNMPSMIVGPSRSTRVMRAGEHRAASAPMLPSVNTRPIEPGAVVPLAHGVQQDTRPSSSTRRSSRSRCCPRSCAARGAART